MHFDHTCESSTEWRTGGLGIGGAVGVSSLRSRSSSAGCDAAASSASSLAPAPPFALLIARNAFSNAAAKASAFRPSSSV